MTSFTRAPCPPPQNRLAPTTCTAPLTRCSFVTDISEPCSFLEKPSPSETRASTPQSLPQTCIIDFGHESFSWDTTSFNAWSYLLPEEQNGDWRSEALHALKNPQETASTIDETLPKVIDKLAESARETADNFHDSLNRAFQGKDLQAMHDKVARLIPKVHIPTMRQVSRSMDSLSDRAQSFVDHHRSVRFVTEELSGHHLVFAAHMGPRARRALVKQGVCKEWQVMPARSTTAWQARLDAALARTFTAEKKDFSVSQLFAMEPIWYLDATGKFWRLKLGSDLMEIVVDTVHDGFEERQICVEVGFEVPKGYWSMGEGPRQQNKKVRAADDEADAWDMI